MKSLIGIILQPVRNLVVPAPCTNILVTRYLNTLVLAWGYDVGPTLLTEHQQADDQKLLHTRINVLAPTQTIMSSD